jgi:hypothetical protein
MAKYERWKKGDGVETLQKGKYVFVLSWMTSELYFLDFQVVQGDEVIEYVTLGSFHEKENAKAAAKLLIKHLPDSGA